MNNRLQQFLAAENISQAQLADSLNVARAGVSHIIAGRNKPSYDFLNALITRYPRLNIEWLMIGKGKMYKESPEQSVEPSKVENDVLFSDEEIFDSQEDSFKPLTIENSEEKPEPVPNTQISLKQRNVKKVIILYDDGSFQEM